MFRFSQILKRGVTFNNVVNCRSLYSPSTLGLEGYCALRKKIFEHFSNDKFRSKMSELIKGDMTIFTDDLKNMVHIAEDNPTDLELVEQMIYKFSKQNKELRFGNFVFEPSGPVVMRLFHHINNADLALKLFRDPAMDGFFDQLITYQLLTDMLYEEGRFEDVIDVFQIIRSRQIQGGMYPRYVVVLVFAACHKENTPESFKYASKLWSELISIGHIPMRRAANFAAVLALKQNAPHTAIEIVGTVPKQNYVTIRNIKVLALAELGRIDDAFPILRSVLEINDPTLIKHAFTKDVLDRLKHIVTENGNSELVQKYSKIEKSLIEHGHITNSTLNDLVTSEIDSPRNTSFGKDAVLAASYRDNRQQNNYNPRTAKFPHRRPGLMDLA